MLRNLKGRLWDVKKSDDESMSDSSDDLPLESDALIMFPSVSNMPQKVDGLSHIVGCAERAKTLRKKLKDLRKKPEPAAGNRPKVKKYISEEVMMMNLQD